MLQMATKQGEEERATARPRRHGASVRQPWTRGGAAGEKTPDAVRERKSRGRTSHTVTRSLQPAAPSLHAVIAASRSKLSHDSVSLVNAS